MSIVKDNDLKAGSSCLKPPPVSTLKEIRKDLVSAEKTLGHRTDKGLFGILLSLLSHLPSQVPFLISLAINEMSQHVEHKPMSELVKMGPNPKPICKTPTYHTYTSMHFSNMQREVDMVLQEYNWVMLFLFVSTLRNIQQTNQRKVSVV